MSLSGMSRRPVSTFPISPSIVGKLSQAGLATVRDIHPLTSKELVTKTNLSKSEAESVIETICGAKDFQASKCKSAFDRWKERQEEGGIVTFCQRLDTTLNGGIHLKRITEISGVPGVGKTQLCMQLAVDTHIPDRLGGQEGETVYLDTEGTLVAERLADLAQGVVDHCDIMTRHTDTEQTLTVEKILSGIHCFRCQDHTQLTATVDFLNQFLSQHPKVRLVVIDSVAAPFRNHVEDISLRTRLLGKFSQSLLQLASGHNIAIVLTNQMTTRFHGSQSNVIPALGESWGHCCATRVLLHWEDGHRHASVLKSMQAQHTCPFTVTIAGLRDVIPADPGGTSSLVKDTLPDDQHTHNCTNNVDPPHTRDFSTTASDTSQNFHPPRKRQKHC